MVWEKDNKTAKNIIFNSKNEPILIESPEEAIVDLATGEETKPFVTIRYNKKDYIFELDSSDATRAFYKPVSKLGITNFALEYEFSNPSLKSVYEKNNISISEQEYQNAQKKTSEMYNIENINEQIQKLEEQGVITKECD